ncbi:hypothetical protein WJX72_000595 [[Myrmecia] bisecta]|uniref:Uncharacterized protein n=1 Tax=[Myrmecia] bisecta TaxID=41462 RepID=A0AAW1R5H5_9CHLO
MDVADPVPVTSDKFSRLAAVLGALDSSGPSSVKCSAVNGQPAAAWSLNRGGVFRAGRDPEDSSDEGEADQHGRQELLPGSFVDDEDEEERELPSTCYTLDEPVVVGGGDTGSGAGEQRELEKAARDALAVATAKADTSGRPDPTAAAEQRAELPAFGAGIPFRPRASRNMPNGQQQQQQSSKTNVEGRDMPKPAADIAIPDDEEAAEDTMEVDAAMDVHAAAGPAANGTGATAGRPQRKRQYRARQQRGDEEL